MPRITIAPSACYPTWTTYWKRSFVWDWFHSCNVIRYRMVSRWFPLYSTAQALVEIADHTKHLLDEIHCVISIFLDFKKVFDRVRSAILLYKLECYGIGGLANDFFISYLTNSLQYTDTVINGVNPDLWAVSCGVPQESLLGPNFFFIVYQWSPQICRV